MFNFRSFVFKHISQAILQSNNNQVRWKGIGYVVWSPEFKVLARADTNILITDYVHISGADLVIVILTDFVYLCFFDF